MSYENAIVNATAKNLLTLTLIQNFFATILASMIFAKLCEKLAIGKILYGLYGRFIGKTNYIAGLQKQHGMVARLSSVMKAGTYLIAIVFSFFYFKQDKQRTLHTQQGPLVIDTSNGVLGSLLFFILCHPVIIPAAINYLQKDFITFWNCLFSKQQSAPKQTADLVDTTPARRQPHDVFLSSNSANNDADVMAITASADAAEKNGDDKDNHQKPLKIKRHSSTTAPAARSGALNEAPTLPQHTFHIGKKTLYHPPKPGQTHQLFRLFASLENARPLFGIVLVDESSVSPEAIRAHEHCLGRRGGVVHLAKNQYKTHPEGAYGDQRIFSDGRKYLSDDGNATAIVFNDLREGNEAHKGS